MKKLQGSILAVVSCPVCLRTVSGQVGSKPCDDRSSINAIRRYGNAVFSSFAVSGDKPGPWKVGIHAWAYEPANRTPNCTVRTGISAPARLRAYACGMSLKNPVTMRARAQGFQGSFGRSLAPV